MNNRTDILFAITLCLIAFVVYGNIFNNGFLLDDEALVVNNPLIKSTQLLPLVFRTGLYDYPEMNLHKIPFNKMYRPMQLLSYSLEYRLWGLNPRRFHLTNVILHIFNALLVYYLISFLINKAIARFATILFLIHPIHVSVVSYISARADLLVCFFMLLSMIYFIRFLSHKSVGYYLLSLLFAAGALLCKESALILFLFIILLLRLQKAHRQYYLLIVPFLILNIAYVILRFILFGALAVSTHPAFLPLPIHLINFINIIARYIFILIIPKDLRLFHTTPFICQFFSPETLLLGVILTVVIYLFFRFRKHRVILFTSSWFLIGMIPVYFFLDGHRGISGQAIMAESWVYLSSIGFFVFVSFIITRWPILKIGFILVSIIYASLTIANNLNWQDSLNVYKNTLRYLPQKNTLRKYLILEYLKEGLYQSAFQEITQFSRDYPESSLRYILLGRYYYATGKIALAIENFNIALSLGKDNYETYYNLGLCYEELGELEKAREVINYSLLINPRYFDSLVKLGDLQLKVKGMGCKEAKVYYKRAFDIDPSNTALAEKIKRCSAD